MIEENTAESLLVAKVMMIRELSARPHGVFTPTPKFSGHPQV